jgi:hypothetical protein
MITIILPRYLGSSELLTADSMIREPPPLSGFKAASWVLNFNFSLNSQHSGGSGVWGGDV